MHIFFIMFIATTISITFVTLHISDHFITLFLYTSIILNRFEKLHIGELNFYWHSAKLGMKRKYFAGLNKV